MSRSGYCDDIEDYWAWIRWRGAVNAAIRGQRGQRFFRDLIAALDAMPNKELHEGSLVTADGDVCALGALGRMRGIDVEALSPDDPNTVAATFGIAEALARETVFENDEQLPFLETPAQRWQRMRNWAQNNLRAEEPET